MSAAAAAPRRSNHVSSNLAESDGDTWQEKLAVCEGVTNDGNPKLIIRSYYRNNRTGERNWDEPPSGAGKIKYATSEMRRMAQVQMDELQLTLEMIPPEETSIAKNEKQMKSKKDKKGIFGMFAKKKGKKSVDVSRDLNLQRAIARSMADQGGHNNGHTNEPVVYFDSGAGQNGDMDDPDLALAKALSLSASGSPSLTENIGNTLNLTEEEMLQRALEESRLEAQNNHATGVAGLSDFSSSPNADLAPESTEKEHSKKYSDQKMPAKQTSTSTFDPYVRKKKS